MRGHAGRRGAAVRATRLALAPLVALVLTACAQAQPPSAARDVVVERLFMGRNVPAGGMVSDAAWTMFLAEVVTPRFPAGFTHWSAHGQWRGASGQVEREPSFVLELVRPPDAAGDAAVLAIIEEYKRRFGQEAVMRVVVPARVSF